jgi:2-dehydro-3-deoxygluconokinase
VKKYITFGELMLRLSPPRGEVFLQTPGFVATFGGAEANVAVALANFGEETALVTVLPDNALGDAAIRELRGFAVDVSKIKRGGDRIGVYYAEAGVAMRPSKVIYDRAGSAITTVGEGDFDWREILAGASWFHTTGITPAISSGAAAATLAAVRTAGAMGVKVSLDLNYRRKLWKWGKTPGEVMPEIVKHVDVLIANEEDCQKCLGIDVDVDVCAGSLDTKIYEKLAAEVMRRFPNITHLAVSLRESISADWNNWSLIMATRNGFHQSKKYEIRCIVDRIGGGDSFASGLIWGLNHTESPAEALEFAAAASALKHTIYGDYNRIGVADVKNLAAGDASGRVQR